MKLVSHKCQNVDIPKIRLNKLNNVYFNHQFVG